MTPWDTLLMEQIAGIGASLRSQGAIVTEDDGYEWVDERKAPERARLYQGMVRLAYARGLMP